MERFFLALRARLARLAPLRSWAARAACVSTPGMEPQSGGENREPRHEKNPETASRKGIHADRKHDCHGHPQLWHPYSGLVLYPGSESQLPVANSIHRPGKGPGSAGNDFYRSRYTDAF